MCSEWVVLDLVGTEEVVDVVNKEHTPELPATEQLPAELPAEELEEPEEEEVREIGCWADLVRDAAPFKPLTRKADVEEDLVDLEAFLVAQERAVAKAEGAERSAEESAKDAAQAKFDKKAKNLSFGHTLRAKRHLAQVGLKGTHVLLAPSDAAQDALLPINPERNSGVWLRRGCGSLVPLEGPQRYMSAEELALDLGGEVVALKAGAGRNAACAGFAVSAVEVPDADGKKKRYIVCEAQKATKYVKHERSSAKNWAKSSRVAQEQSMHRAWRDEIRGGVSAHRDGLAF
jgi:hypothetical protein